MNIVIRTDASIKIGSGHVMRCLTLADELRLRGADVLFVCRAHSGHLIGLIEGKGYRVKSLDLPKAEYDATNSSDKLNNSANYVAHAAWLGVSWQLDAIETIAAMGDFKADLLVVDHYAVDHSWEEKLRPLVGKIMVIDDLADRHHTCDLILDQNLYEDMETRYADLVPSNCQKMLGPRYALLRPEFASVRKSLRKRDGQVRRVLVFMGGVDPTNETKKVLYALIEIKHRQFEVDVVVGGGNFYKEQIQNFCAMHNGFHYHSQVENMAELMAAADLAIGAGGSTTWERCSVGLPSLVMAVAGNQQELAETGARRGLFFYLGNSKIISIEKIYGVLKVFIAASESLHFYCANALATVDATGLNRVAGLLFPPQISIRRAAIEDCDSIYEWRNAAETRHYIFEAKTISLETHRIWFNHTLNNPNRLLLIGEIDTKPVGVLRYDISEDEALISVYLVPGSKGRGVGSQLIRCGSRWIREYYPKIKIINAEIFKENVVSLRAFENAGYKEHHSIYKEEI